MAKPRHTNQLTVKKIARLKKPGRYADGGGLSLLVSDIGSKSWSFRYERNGRDRAMVLGLLHGDGGATTIPRNERRGLTLDEARAEAAKNLDLLKQGIDPIDAKNSLKQSNIQRAAETAKLKTFEQLAVEYNEAHKTDWENANYRGKFLSSLKKYAFPKIGQLLPSVIDVTLVREVIEPIWLTKHHTADKVRSRIENVLDYATALKLRSEENPARWSVLEAVLPKKIVSDNHFEALPYGDIPDFVAKLRNLGNLGTTDRERDILYRRGEALEFLILTGARTNEVLRAPRSEFELNAVWRTVRDDQGKEQRVMGPCWIIPKERMKGKKGKRRQHRVPLSDRAVEILKARMREGDSPNSFVFTSDGKKPFGQNTLWNLLIEMGYDQRDPVTGERDDITPHGFRSSFRDWAGEETQVAADICEAAIAHVVGNSTQTSYQHGTYFEKRRELMNEWGRYCLGLPPLNKDMMVPKHHASVVSLDERRKVGA